LDFPFITNKLLGEKEIFKTSFEELLQPHSKEKRKQKNKVKKSLIFSRN